VMREIPVVQLGLGGVGRALIEHMIAAESTGVLARRWRIRPRWIAVADSRGFLFRPQGLTSLELHCVLDEKNCGDGLDGIEGFVAGGAQCVLNLIDEPGILVDVTAAQGMEGSLLKAVERGWGVVLANKRPLAGSHDVFARLKSSGWLRHEATVGAGLPVISTIDSLLDAGDSITSIEGCLSGTLGYICTALEDEVPFSLALREAMEKGYTEPDPREDLSGLDVARKALILARLLGWTLEMVDVQIESLHTPAMAAMTREDFMASICALDEPYARRAAEARSGGSALRYVARIQDEGCTVGLQDVSGRELMGSLRGTDNIVAIHTARYSRSPLIVAGAGAGREVTAAGVLGDILSLAREMAV